MHALKCCINEACLFCHDAVFIRLFSEDQSSRENVDVLQRQESQLDCHHGAADQETVPSGHKR